MLDAKKESAFKPISTDQKLTMFDPCGSINAEHIDCCATNRSFSFENGAAPPKMFVPFLHSGIEQRDEFVGNWIVTRDVRTFCGVAISACIRQVFSLAAAAVLPCANVINLVG